MLGVEPLLGQQATKQTALHRINSVALIHIHMHTVILKEKKLPLQHLFVFLTGYLKRVSTY